ncbi:MAG: ribonuclease domain-containing protein [Candidatus Dactylopiibacterium sp.]|nr:ribonuclease domain-containing protein [Candidatus Dactylopiibacterium sp.]
MPALRALFQRTLLCLAFGLALVAPAQARDDRLATIALAALPAEARETLQRIERGGPHPYRRDGVEFQNRERRLPLRQRGYYREYTVSTPGERTRGARRIVAGEAREYYYTPDHYRSFRRIVQP